MSLKEPSSTGLIVMIVLEMSMMLTFTSESSIKFVYGICACQLECAVTHGQHYTDVD